MKILTAILLVLCSAALCDAQNSNAQKPNVLLIFVDDLGWADLGCYDSTFYDTPNIDALSASGIKFTNAYSACPVCSPTRAALMTGKAPQRVGITQWIPQPSPVHLPHSEVTIGETFKEAGYQTGYMGKWHLGEKDDQLPDHHGFDVIQGVNRAGQPANYFFPFKGRQREGIHYWDVPDFEDGSDGDYLTDKLTNKAIDFIKQPREQPFFLCLAHYAVHTPIQVPKETEQTYGRKRKQLFGESETPILEHKFDTVARGRQDNAKYAAMMKNLDDNTGRLMDALKKAGLEDDTIVVFTSDNGGHCHLKKKPGFTCNLPLRSGKGWTYEGGIRIPAIVSWKDKIAPTTSDIPMITMDLYPTLLDLAGLSLKPEQHLDGLSLKSAMEAKPEKALTERFVAWSYPHRHGSGHRPSDAIREGFWKLISNREDKSKELYNLKNDLGEQTNLIEQHPEKAEQLSAKLDEWLEQTNSPK